MFNLPHNSDEQLAYVVIDFENKKDFNSCINNKKNLVPLSIKAIPEPEHNRVIAIFYFDESSSETMAEIIMWITNSDSPFKAEEILKEKGLALPLIHFFY